MEHNTEKLLSAIGDVDTAYLEEALDFDAANAGRKRAVRFPKLSAACVAVLVILGVSVTAFAVSRLPLSWRDIFSPEQTVIGDGDETPVVSQQQPTAAAEELHIRVEKVISDERTLYLLYSVKANEGAVLDQSGQFADFELYFPGQMMSGAYVSSFLPRKEGVPENELEGVVYANWQPGSSANGLVMTFANWQEKRWFDDETIDFNVAEMVENAGKNARLPQCQERSRNGTVRYYWQPGDADVQLPCGASICNAGWEDGVLQLVMKEPVGSDEWSATWEKNWYFLDTRTDTVIYPEPHGHFGQPGDFDPEAADVEAYFARCNRQTLLIPQCETLEALEHIEEITAMDGVDGIFVGPYDLSVALGRPAQMDNPALVAAIERVLAACKANGKLSMIYAGDAAASARLLRQGFDCVACGMDSILLIQAAKQLKADVEALL